MSELTEQEIMMAHGFALSHWHQPNNRFTSGFDPRSSDNAMLTLLYGGLARAKQHNWLNAGRRLIDKTYVHILGTTQGLSAMSFSNAEQIAATLDSFIRERLAPLWSSFSHQEEGLAPYLLLDASESLFGSTKSEVAASQLLFWLCPTLSIAPYSRGHLTALARIGHGVQDESYLDYKQVWNQALETYAPLLSELDKPKAIYGSEQESELINQLLEKSDWWQRRVFDMALRQKLYNQGGDTVMFPLFGCNSQGGLL